MKERLLFGTSVLVGRLVRSLDAAAGRHHLSKIKVKGDGVAIWGKVSIRGHDQIVLGNNVHIGHNAFIRAEGGLKIGDNTHISRNLVLYTQNHSYEGKRIPYDDSHTLRPVVIGRNVWIGMNVCVAPGTAIGDGVIVGMGTVVSGKVPPMSIIGSERWRTLAFRNRAHYDALDRERSYAGPSGIAYRPGNVGSSTELGLGDVDEPGGEHKF